REDRGGVEPAGDAHEGRPARPARAAREGRHVDGRGSHGGHGSLKRVSDPPPKRRVLVVDDEPGLRDMLSILLRREGLDVTLAPGFVAGCEAVKNAPEPYGVILTDLVMPDGSGLDLLSLSKQRSPQTEVIVMTAHSTL